MINVYVGYDRNFGDGAFQVCEKSILEHASVPVNIVKLDQGWLRRIGMYRRQFFKKEEQCYDTMDGLPFSTEFSYSRFLTPSLQPSGWAIFCDSDFLFRADIAELYGLLDNRYALMCVKHDYKPKDTVKMQGQVQAPYRRKNWTSLMAFNVDKQGARITPYQVNTMAGSWLHQLTWLSDSEIGEIPEAWNWLDGHSSEGIDPKAVHFTRGTPDMGKPWDTTKYAAEWLATWSSLNGKD